MTAYLHISFPCRCSAIKIRSFEKNIVSGLFPEIKDRLLMLPFLFQFFFFLLLIFEQVQLNRTESVRCPFRFNMKRRNSQPSDHQSGISNTLKNRQ